MQNSTLIVPSNRNFMINDPQIDSVVNLNNINSQSRGFSFQFDVDYTINGNTLYVANIINFDGKGNNAAAFLSPYNNPYLPQSSLYVITNPYPFLGRNVTQSYIDNNPAFKNSYVVFYGVAMSLVSYAGDYNHDGKGDMFISYNDVEHGNTCITIIYGGDSFIGGSVLNYQDGIKGILLYIPGTFYFTSVIAVDDLNNDNDPNDLCISRNTGNVVATCIFSILPNGTNIDAVTNSSQVVSFTSSGNSYGRISIAGTGNLADADATASIAIGLPTGGDGYYGSVYVVRQANLGGFTQSYYDLATMVQNGQAVQICYICQGGNGNPDQLFGSAVASLDIDQNGQLGLLTMNNRFIYGIYGPLTGLNVIQLNSYSNYFYTDSGCIEEVANLFSQPSYGVEGFTSVFVTSGQQACNNQFFNNQGFNHPKGDIIPYISLITGEYGVAQSELGNQATSLGDLFNQQKQCFAISDPMYGPNYQGKIYVYCDGTISPSPEPHSSNNGPFIEAIVGGVAGAVITVALAGFAWYGATHGWFKGWCAGAGQHDGGHYTEMP